jgi:conjugative transfer signal peptidase TraF
MSRWSAWLAGGVVVAALTSAALPMMRLLVWNATPSVPTGLYRIGGTDGLRIGERVAIDPPATLRTYLAKRGYLPVEVPLLKEVAALSGQTVCRSERMLTIDGRIVGTARLLDSRGRRLPVWKGCHTLRRGDIFVMNLRAPGSFDGRYFGIMSREVVIGRAVPVWTDERGDGAYVWFAGRAAVPPPRSPRSLPTTNEGDEP